MEAKYITLTKENIEKEHICCAFSDKKCKDSYELKKTWLKNLTEGREELPFFYINGKQYFLHVDKGYL